jgi:hypothetical protein
MNLAMKTNYLLMKKSLFSFIFLSLSVGVFGQVLVEEITIACGNKFFSECEHQNALIVRGIWCGNSFFWTPIGIGDTITEEAYRNDELFTGDCIDIDAEGNVIGEYSFENGKIKSLKHFQEDGSPREAFNYKNGIPDGLNIDYFSNGEIRLQHTFKNGILDGPFIENVDLVDYGRGYCLQEGIYVKGVRKLTSSPCDYSFNKGE